MLDTGDTIPDLPLALSGGATSSLGAYAGRWLVLYFYPKDSTPGCTTEGQDFNTVLPKLRKLDAEVLGVSRDSVKSHDNFCAKQGFRFALVSDKDEALRSEEHTSELQSLMRISYAVFCLKKKK